jgi:signal transduction histidine kinase
MIAELQQLRDRLTDVQQAQLLGQERERIAGALHDQIEQQVFTIGLRLDALLDAGGTDPQLTHELRDLRELSIEAADEVRRAIFSLSGSEHEGNLIDDLRSLLRELERTSDLHAHLSVSGQVTNGVEAVHDLVHLVVKEALTNVRKHAAARLVLVTLRCEVDRLEIVVQDDGVGAPETLLRTFPDSYLHFGLRHIRQLTLDRGGTFSLAVGEEAGLVMRVSVPLGAPQP